MTRFPANASYARKVRNEALMVYAFFGHDELPSGSLLIPDSPYFIAMFLCDQDPIERPFTGRYYEKGGRFVCWGTPSPVSASRPSSISRAPSSATSGATCRRQSPASASRSTPASPATVAAPRPSSTELTCSNDEIMPASGALDRGSEPVVARRRFTRLRPFSAPSAAAPLGKPRREKLALVFAEPKRVHPWPFHVSLLEQVTR